MTQANERTATLTALVAEEIRALMARRRMSGRQLATQLDVSPSWVSYRLTGTQPIDLNDLAMIAGALEVGVHELLPPPGIAATARRDAGGELKKNLAGPHVPARNDTVRPPQAHRVAPQRHDSVRPDSSVPASRRRPVSLRPPNKPMAA